MFAEVYLVTRLPRRFGVFDYTCDAHMQTGDLVRVPLRGRSVLGVVRVTKTESKITKRLSPIERVVIPSLFSDADIKRIEYISQLIVQSPSTLFYQTLIGIERSPSPQTRPTGAFTPAICEQIVQQVKHADPHSTAFIQGSIETCIALIYRFARSLQGQLLVITPHETDARDLASYLQREKRISYLHGHTTHNERSHIIRAWRSGETDILIGTKQASLLPAHELTMLIVYNPTHSDHVQYDRNPRFDAVHAAHLLAKQHNAQILCCGPTPRITEIPTATSLSNANFATVELTAPDEKTTTPFLSHSLKTKIDACLAQKKRSIILYNRKGYARRLQCKDCGHIPYCGSCGSVPKMREDDLVCHVCKTEMWIPTSCPSCKGENLRPRGIGNQRLVKKWREAFPDVRIVIVDKQNHKYLDADILLVTEYFFQTLHHAFKRWYVGVVADACTDLHMSNDADAGLQMASRAHRLALFAQTQRADCLIQTFTPTLIRPMEDLPAFIDQERLTRETYHLPPFTYRIAIRWKKERPPLMEELKQYINQDNQLHWFEMSDIVEILTPPEKYGKIRSYLQQLPDHCIIQVTYA